MINKTCKKCGEEKPATSEYYPKNKTYKDGLTNTCKHCKKAEDKIYRESNKDYYKEYKKEYYNNNKDEILRKQKEYVKSKKDKVAETQRNYRSNHKQKLSEYAKEYRIENRDKLITTSKQYHTANKERCNENSRQYYLKNKTRLTNINKEWKLNNQEKAKKLQEDYYIKNREKRLKHVRKWQSENKTRVSIYQHKRRAKIKNLRHDLTECQWLDTKSYFNDECAYCGQITETLQQDHFTPLVMDGEYTKHNILPACPKCNQSKNSSEPLEWYRTREFYSYERECKILNFIDEVKKLDK